MIGNTWGYLASAAGGRAEYAFAIFLLSVFPFMIFNGALVEPMGNLLGKMWEKSMGKMWEKSMGNLRETYGKYEKHMGNLWETYGKSR